MALCRIACGAPRSASASPWVAAVSAPSRCIYTHRGADTRVVTPPPRYDISRMPEKTKLPIVLRVPNHYNINVKTPRTGKELYRMMGEETVHNRLLLGQFGIVALGGGRMAYEHFEVIRHATNRFLKDGKSFPMYRVDPPHQPVTKRGEGKRMGGGKGPIKHYVTPVKAGRVIVEVAGEVLWEEVQPWMALLAERLPFPALAVNKQMIDNLDAEERRLAEINENPYTFEWLVRNNIFDCHKFVSPRDRKWFGRFVYRDRTLNKKWNEILQTRTHQK